MMVYSDNNGKGWKWLQIMGLKGFTITVVTIITLVKMDGVLKVVKMY